jgi:predicted nucleotidyltransferase
MYAIPLRSTRAVDTKAKYDLMREVAQCLGQASEVSRIVVFGSFLRSESPNDMDIAVFQDTDDPYLPLALKYRRMAKPVSDSIPLDIVPVRPGASGPMIDEIGKGEVIYER